jgi:hypothetical protein
VNGPWGRRVAPGRIWNLTPIISSRRNNAIGLFGRNPEGTWLKPRHSSLRS